MENLVIFEAYKGKSYACSPKAIYEAMLQDKQYQNYTFVWAFTDPASKKDIDKLANATLVKHSSKAYFSYYSRAKYWVSNSRIEEAILKRKDQIYIQTWHGTPLKRLGFDIIHEKGNVLNSIAEIHSKYQMDAKRYDYMLSPSAFCSLVFTSAFGLNRYYKENILLESGYPRNDFLYQYTQQDVITFKKKMNLPDDKKIILYAPTFRDNSYEVGVGYTYSMALDFDLLKQKLGNNFVILVRAHYLVANQFDFEKYKGFVYDVASIEDINYLYIVSDILITDYSSVFFDYANLKRPIIFYMYDEKEYENSIRGFYIDLAELPGPIVKEMDTLVSTINETADSFTYDEKYKRFNDTYTYLDNKNSSIEVVKTCFK